MLSRPGRVLTIGPATRDWRRGLMNLIGLSPLAFAALLVSVVFLTPHSRWLNAAMTRLARRYFGRYVPEDAPDRRRRLRSAYIEETYRTYATKSYLLTAIAAVAGVVLGVYLTGGALLALPAVKAFVENLPSAMSGPLGAIVVVPELTERQVLTILTVGGTIIGLIIAGLTYWYRWESPRSHAEVRRRGINEGLPRTVAFIYALSRGGMAMPKVLRTLADNRDVYGHGADEISVAVREMDLFGRDVVTAVRHVGQRTPSEQFKTFSENFASVLQSGQNLTEFLRAQYDRYTDEAEDRQEEILELLATIAEAYVTTLVAGTLFLMTILLVFGLTTAETLGFLKLMAYVMIPLANVLFIVYLSGKLELLGVARGSSTGALRAAIDTNYSLPEPVSRSDAGHAGSDPAAGSGDDTAGHRADGAAGHRADGAAGHRADGGAATDRSPISAIRGQLSAYDRVATVKRVLARPVDTLLRRPTSILYVTVPVALLIVAIRAPNAFGPGGLQVRIIDDIVIQAVLFVLIPFAVVWELYSRRISKLEAALPELLDRLASLNEAGMSMIEGFERVRESDLGPLSVEVDRIWRDLEYGANVDDALRRFGLRVRTTATTRVVTLLSNALRASGNLGPVLRVAGEQAASELTLRRKRRQQMFTYLVVIYISFLVFLVIIGAIQEVLVPSLPNNVPTPEDTDRLSVDVNAFARFGQVNKAAYTLVFFHTALVQAVLSGFIAGQIGEGSLKDGAKHAAIMLTVAYVVFLLLSTPVAQVTFENQQIRGDTVTVDQVSVSSGGFVTLRTRAADGQVVGQSAYLEPGTHRNVEITLEEGFNERITLYAVPHLDTNENKRFDFVEGGSADGTYPKERTRIYDSADIRKPGVSERTALDAPQSFSVDDVPRAWSLRAISGSAG